MGCHFMSFVVPNFVRSPSSEIHHGHHQGHHADRLKPKSRTDKDRKSFDAKQLNKQTILFAFFFALFNFQALSTRKAN